MGKGWTKPIVAMDRKFLSKNRRNTNNRVRVVSTEQTTEKKTLVVTKRQAKRQSKNAKKMDLLKDFGIDFDLNLKSQTVTPQSTKSTEVQSSIETVSPVPATPVTVQSDQPVSKSKKVLVTEAVTETKIKDETTKAAKAGAE